MLHFLIFEFINVKTSKRSAPSHQGTNKRKKDRKLCAVGFNEICSGNIYCGCNRFSQHKAHVVIVKSYKNSFTSALSIGAHTHTHTYMQTSLYSSDFDTVEKPFLHE